MSDIIPPNECEYFIANLQLADLQAVTTAAGLKPKAKTRTTKKVWISYLIEAGKRSLLKDAVTCRQTRKSEKKRKSQKNKNDSKRVQREVKHHLRMQEPVVGNREPGTHDRHLFMVAPTEEETKALYESFYEATGNESLKHTICAVCGRSRMASETTTTTIPIAEIPNKGCLRCNQENASPTLIHSLLLEPKGCVLTEDDEPLANVCKECLEELKKGSDDVNAPPPRLSYANGLWYGPQPEDLTCLTLPEQLLIGLYIPRVYVIKLQPRRGANGFDPDTLQSALVGNVISFEQNTQRIVEMTEGSLMPRKPSILAELITIAVVSAGPLQKVMAATHIQSSKICCMEGSTVAEEAQLVLSRYQD
ncbi:hypothetical protein QCA50_013642 [Cerrena zonata]|uniref:DUF6570 domain-containing protein n=1 Tax=Cerrena zonata TaxID=2478898 RepID=A0AAW0G2V3_9APHY